MSVVCWELLRAWLKAVTLATVSISGIWVRLNILASRRDSGYYDKQDRLLVRKNLIFPEGFVFKHLWGQGNEGKDGQLDKAARGDADFFTAPPTPPSPTFSCLKGCKYWLRSVICIQQGMFDLGFPISQGSTVSDNSQSIPGPLPLVKHFGAQYLHIYWNREWKNDLVAVNRAISRAVRLLRSIFQGICLNFVQSYKASMREIAIRLLPFCLRLKYTKFVVVCCQVRTQELL